MMSEQKFKKLAGRGFGIDRNILPKNPQAALSDYEELFQEMVKDKEVDSFLLCKITLSMMLANVRLKDYQAAFNLWTDQDSLFSIAIQTIENGGVSENDTILYLQLSAFLNSLSTGDRKEAAGTVNDLSRKICDYGKELAPEMLPYFLGNWRAHLAELFDGNPPPEHLKILMDYERESGKGPAQKTIRFLEPSKWEITWE